MKVIEHGSSYIGDEKKFLKEWKTNVRCGKDDKSDRSEPCGALFEVKADDLLHRYWLGTHSSHSYTAVRCPECGKINRVREVPEIVFRYALSRKEAVWDGFEDG